MTASETPAKSAAAKTATRDPREGGATPRASINPQDEGRAGAVAGSEQFPGLVDNHNRLENANQDKPTGSAKALAETPDEELGTEQLSVKHDGGLAAARNVGLMQTEDIQPRNKKEATVRCNVPRSFNLTTDDGRTHNYGPGEQDLPKSHAEHWYAEQNGVEIKSSKK